MQTYRSKQTIEAVQFQGAEIAGVTCHGGPGDDPIAQSRVRMTNGCDGSRAHLPHVHANVTGGMQVLAPGWWIYPVEGGPWGACSDEKFRASWEVPEKVTEPVIPSEDMAAAPGADITAVPPVETFPVAAPNAPDPATFPETVPAAEIPVVVVPAAAPVGPTVTPAAKKAAKSAPSVVAPSADSVAAPDAVRSPTE